MKLTMIILVFAAFAYCEVTYQPKPRLNNSWQSDSLFIGAEIVAIDSTKEVKVTWLRSMHTDGLGKLYFLMPGHQDSAKFLFHNFHNRFPSEPTTISLGYFPANTQLVFMYKVVDSTEKWKYYYNKKLYTGQNRDSVDHYVSTRPKNNIYGKRFSAAGMVSADKVEVGFTDARQLAFCNIMFEIENVVLKK